MRKGYWGLIAGTLVMISGCGQGADTTDYTADDPVPSEMIVLATNEYSYPSARLTTQVAEAVPSPVPSVTAPDLSGDSIPLEDPVFIPETPNNMQIQQALQNAGRYNGKIDGVIGPKSRKAILEFQKNNDLVMDGKVGKKTWARLGPYLNKSSPESVNPADIPDNPNEWE